jgi:hypothetical protein
LPIESIEDNCLSTTRLAARCSNLRIIFEPLKRAALAECVPPLVIIVSLSLSLSLTLLYSLNYLVFVYYAPVCICISGCVMYTRHIMLLIGITTINITIMINDDDDVMIDDNDEREINLHIIR